MDQSEDEAASEHPGLAPLVPKRRTSPRHVTLWNDKAFRERVYRFASQRGVGITDLCLGAGLSRFYLYKDAGASGRSIEAIIRLARGLGVTVPELIEDCCKTHLPKLIDKAPVLRRKDKA